MAALVLALLLWLLPTASFAEDGPAPPAPLDLSEANALVRDGSYAEADAKLAALQEGNPDDPALLLLRGEVLLALNRPEPARPHLERSTELDPANQRGWFQLGNARQATGDGPGALEAYQKALETGEDVQIRTFARLNRSLLLQKTREWAGAATELEAVLELDPARGEVYGDLAGLYLETGRLAEAKKTLERGKEAGFGSAQLFYVLGVRQHEKKRREEAAEAFGRALEIDPQMAAAEKSVAVVLSEMGRNREAAAHLRRYLELVPKAPDSATIREHLRALEGG